MANDFQTGSECEVNPEIGSEGQSGGQDSTNDRLNIGRKEKLTDALHNTQDPLSVLLTKLVSECRTYGVNSVLYLENIADLVSPTYYASTSSFPKKNFRALINIYNRAKKSDETAGSIPPHLTDYSFKSDDKNKISLIQIDSFGSTFLKTRFLLVFDKQVSLNVETLDKLQWLCHKTTLEVEKHASGNGNIVNFTPREVEVIKYVARGMSNPEIAKKLAISPHTISAYLKIIYLKCDLNDRVSLSLYALKNSII